jgi:uncharacterized protein YbaR (Trm112 family)
MKKDLLAIIVCPTCKGTLDLKIAQKTNPNNIIEGTLTCTKCSHKYEIKNSIPNLIPYG